MNQIHAINLMILSTEQQLQSHEYNVFIDNYSKLKNILNINLKNLVDRFVTVRIIDIEDKDTIGIDSLLYNIGLHLKSGINSTFHKMVDVMKESGNLAVEELGRKIKTQLDMPSIDKASTVDFTIINDVEHMFVALVSALRSMLSEDKFQMLRRGYTTNRRIRKLPSCFIDKIRNTETLDGLFDVVVESPYCNWMNIRLLEQMAAASLQPNIHHLIGQYKNAVYSKRLQDVFQQIPEIEVPEDYYSKVKQKWNKEFDEVTLKDVIGHWDRLEKIFSVEPTLLLERVIKSSVQFHWLIPSELVCHARYAAFKNWDQLDDILYLDICGHVIKDSQYEFSITSSNAGKHIRMYIRVHTICVCVYVCATCSTWTSVYVRARLHVKYIVYVYMYIQCTYMCNTCVFTILSSVCIHTCHCMYSYMSLYVCTAV